MNQSICHTRHCLFYAATQPQLQKQTLKFFCILLLNKFNNPKKQKHIQKLNPKRNERNMFEVKPIK